MGLTLSLGFTTSARTFISFITAYTLNDASFTSLTILTLELWLNGSLVHSFSAVGTNQVWTTGSLITFDTVSLVTTSTNPVGTVQTLCVDSIFALTENYLNPKLNDLGILIGPYGLPQQYLTPVVGYQPTSAIFTQSSTCTNYISPYGSATPLYICSWNHFNSWATF